MITKTNVNEKISDLSCEVYMAEKISGNDINSLLGILSDMLEKTDADLSKTICLNSLLAAQKIAAVKLCNN